MKQPHPDTRRIISDKPPINRTAAPMPDVGGMTRMILPPDKDNAAVVLMGDTPEEVWAKYLKHRQRVPAVDRPATYNGTVVHK